MKERIAVLMGGRSLEREVSLRSGHRVSEALKEKGHPVVKLDIDEHLVSNLKKEKPDLVYIALHGKYGEDGTIQQLLEILDIPYTGPGVFPSMLGFDKILSKEMFVQESIPTPDFFALSSDAFKDLGASAALGEVVAKLGTPVVVKPARQGSALGIKFAQAEAELPNSLLAALSYDDKVLLERYVHGKEIAVSILGNMAPEALPPVEIVPKKGFFDFESMYTMGMTDYFVPARLDESMTKEVQALAVKAHKLLRCRDVSRVDMIIDEKVGPQVLELNTSPGMTETSLLPMAAAEAGKDFPELVEQLVGFALARKTK